MKNRVQMMVATIIVSLFVCGAASAGTTGWANESNAWRYCDVTGEIAYSLACQGGYCASISSDCEPSFYDMTTDTATTAYYSEEQGKFECPNGYILQGFDVNGWDGRGDNIALSCRKTDNLVKDACYWTTWISDENPNTGSAPTSTPVTGWNSPANYVFCTEVDEYIAGMECAGGWCGNMRLYCCNYKTAPIPPSGIDLGPLNTRTNFNVDATQALYIDELTFSGWTPTKIVVGIGSTDGKPMNGMSVSVAGGPGPVALSGYWQQIEIAFVNQPVISLTVSDPAAGTRAMQIQWWAQ